MKKLLALTVAFVCIIISFSVVVNAEGSKISTDNDEAETGFSVSYLPEDYIQVEDPLKDYIPSSEDFMAESMVTRSITRKVNVTQPCDQTWRNKYPSNWMWQSYRVVIKSDEILESVCGVQFVSYSQKYWNRSSTSWTAQLNEAINEWGLSGGADFMMAFSAYLPGSVMGAARRNTPYCIIYDYGYDANWGVGQHESGHCYGLLDYCTGKESDDCCKNACIMNGGNKGKVCSVCRPKLIKAKNWY